MRIKGARNIKRDDVNKVLVRAGWEDTGRGKGSHSVFIHPETKRITTIPFIKEVPKGTLAAIRRQTGLDEIR